MSGPWTGTLVTAGGYIGLGTPEVCASTRFNSFIALDLTHNQEPEPQFYFRDTYSYIATAGRYTYIL